MITIRERQRVMKRNDDFSSIDPGYVLIKIQVESSMHIVSIHILPAPS